MLHRAGIRGGGKWHTYASLGSKVRASLAMCTSPRAPCCSECCSLKHDWNAVWAFVLLSRWCQPHVCTFPLLPDCTPRPPVCPSWLRLFLASRHRPSRKGSCFTNPYLTDSRKGAHLACGISVRQSGAREAAGNSETCVSYCCFPAIITHPSLNDIFVLFSKSSSACCATALWSISWNVMPLRCYSFIRIFKPNATLSTSTASWPIWSNLPDYRWVQPLLNPAGSMDSGHTL